MKTLTISLLLLASGACHKKDITSGNPKCLDAKIAEYSANSSCSDPSVSEYKFQGKTVYAFEPGTCGADMTTEVIDSGCNTLGFLGGIMGNTKINGEDFSNATLVKMTWMK